MGWCSATEIMDTAVRAAHQAVVAALETRGATYDAADQGMVDDLLRPTVESIARALRDGDWDCIEESDYFDRFRQEMLGYDDDRMVEWYREQIDETDDPARVREYSAALAALLEGRT